VVGVLVSTCARRQGKPDERAESPFIARRYGGSELTVSSFQLTVHDAGHSKLETGHSLLIFLCVLADYPVTLLELLPGSAGTRVVASDILPVSGRGILRC